jgi:hypothetical protein
MRSGSFGIGLMGALVGALFALLAFTAGFMSQSLLHAGSETAAHDSPH